MPASLNHSGSAPEREFLETFFRCLNENGIGYSVLRNYDDLPETSAGSDIDICFYDDEEAAVEQLLDAVLRSGGYVLGTVISPGFRQFAIMGRYPGATRQWWGQLIDISSSTYKGLPIASKEVMREQTTSHNGISVLSPKVAAANALVKMILARGELDDRYLRDYRYAGGLENDMFHRAFSPLGSSAIARILRIIEAPENTAPHRLVFSARLATHFGALRSDLFRYLKRRFEFEFSRLYRFYKPPGFSLAVLGVDGAGKSTVIDAINAILDAATHRGVLVRHLRPTLLPPLARLRGKGEVNDAPVVNPHGSTPSGVVGSLVRISYLTLDYVIGYWLKVRPHIAKKAGIVIFDRYAYDMEVDPLRFRIALPARIISWFTFLAPKPDLIFCLYGNPEVLAARKRELPLPEVTRQVTALKSFAGKEPRALLISTEGSIEDARDQVLQAICDFCADRNKK
jgi:thymidylate kinase